MWGFLKVKFEVPFLHLISPCGGPEECSQFFFWPFGLERSTLWYGVIPVLLFLFFLTDRGKCRVYKLGIVVEGEQNFIATILSDFYITIFEGPSGHIWLCAPKSLTRNSISWVFDLSMVALGVSCLPFWGGLPVRDRSVEFRFLDFNM